AGKGRKIWRDEQALRDASAAIEAEYGVAGLLTVAWSQETTQKKKHSKPGRPSETAVAEVAVAMRYRITEVRRNQAAIEDQHKRLGWRAFVTNAAEQRLSLEG